MVEKLNKMEHIKIVVENVEVFDYKNPDRKHVCVPTKSSDVSARNSLSPCNCSMMI